LETQTDVTLLFNFRLTVKRLFDVLGEDA
jgi:hypothetical protein